MSSGISFENLCADYALLLSTASVRPAFRPTAEREAHRIELSRPRYESVSGLIGCPWWMVGIIHSLEGGLDFGTHLHNGDPLTARTKHVPRGRPTGGEPPFSWEESATDALLYEGFDEFKPVIWSSPEGVLYALELFNGMGYRRFHPQVKSPYLWAGTNHYERGKYTSDGRWDANAVSRQIGAAALMLSAGWDRPISR